MRTPGKHLTYQVSQTNILKNQVPKWSFYEVIFNFLTVHLNKKYILSQQSYTHLHLYWSSLVKLCYGKKQLKISMASKQRFFPSSLCYVKTIAFSVALLWMWLSLPGSREAVTLLQVTCYSRVQVKGAALSWYVLMAEGNSITLSQTA